MELRERAIEKLEEAMMLSEAFNECKVTLGYGVVEDILALLKAQEAVESKKLMAKSKNGYKWRFYCGKCGDEIDRLDKYCRHCGRAVKWE